jgi:16S rRNA (adenine1518-N6/adenine1519-N6)-dimethyltransferase
MVAEPGSGDYGILSVFCAYFSLASAAFEVSPNVFYPKPDVTSVLMNLKMRERPDPAAADETFFREMVRSVFGKRRKTLRNSLRYFLQPRGIDLPDLPFLHRRPEELPPGDLVELSNTLFAHAPARNPGLNPA